MCSPLKEVKIFNTNITALRVKIKKSPEDYKESGRLPESGRLQETQRTTRL